jgi:hypothetical protein
MRAIRSIFVVAAGAATVQALTIANALAGDPGGGQVIAVPEPASLAVLAAGVGGLYVLKKLRNRS